MGKIGAYQAETKYRNYSSPTTKKNQAHTPFYRQKVWTLEEQVYKKLEDVAHLLQNLYAKLKGDYSQNVRNNLKKNLTILEDDLNVMKENYRKNPYTFNTRKLSVNENCISEMKCACDTIQAFQIDQNQSKKLSKMKHFLNELEQLIHPKLTRFQESILKARKKKTLPIKAAAKRKTKPKKQIKSKHSTKKTIKSLR